MKRDLEQLARDSGTKWTYSEVVAEVYFAVKDMPLAMGLAHLQGVLSRSALASIQHAAQCVLQEKGPEVEFFGVGYVTPEGAVNLDAIVQVPMEFVRYVSATLIPPIGA
jgi:hypothetical protein